MGTYEATFLLESSNDEIPRSCCHHPFFNYVAPAASLKAEEWEILNDMRLLEVEMDEIELELMKEVPEDLQWRMLVRVEKLYAKIRKMLANINIDFENKGRFRIPVEFRSKCVKARMDQANEI